MLRFFSLSSGSCGNCYYLGTEDNGIIIDAGVSLKQLKKVFQAYNVGIDTIQGIFVTHDHLDHIRALGSFCKRLFKPVYTTEAIHDALLRHSFTSSALLNFTLLLSILSTSLQKPACTQVFPIIPLCLCLVNHSAFLAFFGIYYRLEE